MPTGPSTAAPTPDVSTNDGWLSADALAQALGLSLEAIGEARKNAPVDSTRRGKTRGGVEWSPAGVAWLRGALGVTGEPMPAPALETLTVTRADFPNRRILQARLGENPDTLIVRVADAKNFTPGMNILAERYGQAWSYRGRPEAPLAGPVLPRKKGVW